jgi:hypothetical protein
MLSTICDAFQSEVDQLDPGEQDYAVRLAALTQKLARAASGYCAVPGCDDRPPRQGRARSSRPTLRYDA